MNSCRRSEQFSQRIANDDTNEERCHQDSGAQDILGIPFSQREEGDDISDGIHDQKERERYDAGNRWANNGDESDEPNEYGKQLGHITEKKNDDDDCFLIETEPLGNTNKKNQRKKNENNFPVLLEKITQCPHDHM